ncbi:putative glucan 1,3-beta-glucosidase A [Hordeum vulgare]|nr:putative glucan 1,3-beta-glucosidase A [Hordeum vulgare]
MFLSAVGGSGSDVVANQGEAKNWETLRLWRMKDSDDMFMIRVHDSQFVGLDNNGGLVAVQTSPRQAGLDISFLASVKDFISLGLLQDHWKTFITEEDFRFISSNGVNAVRIPVAWWITKTDDTPSCHPPNYPGYQAMLDRAFQWAEKYNLGVIGDLHAAPWSQNEQSHSSSRDGTVGWGDQKIDETVRVIEGLAARYAAKKSLLGIGLLNEPSEQVHIDTLKKYYKAGYNAVRNQVKRDDVYVIMEGRLVGGGDSKMANFARQFRN